MPNADFAVARVAVRRRTDRLVLSAIAKLMAPSKHPPDLGADTERVRKHLEHDVSVRRAIPQAAQRREAQRVCSIVGEVEAASRLRPDRSSPASSLASGASLRRGCPGPQRFSSGEVTLAADEPDLGLRQHSGDEGIVLLHPPGQLLIRIDREGDLSPELCRDLFQGSEQIGIGQAVARQDRPFC